jgi:methionine--tRNA ligase beta chain
MSESPTDEAWTTGEHGEVEEAPHPAPAPDLRVARVIEARAHPNADRLLVLAIDAGEPAPRQLVAGIAGKYALEELGGLHVVIVANLQPAKLRGEISQGMLLAAPIEGGPEGAIGLLLAPDAAPGTRVAGPGLAEPADQITIDDFKRHELVADEHGMTIDGVRVVQPRLVADRGARGRLR